MLPEGAFIHFAFLSPEGVAFEDTFEFNFAKINGLIESDPIDFKREH